MTSSKYAFGFEKFNFNQPIAAFRNHLISVLYPYQIENISQNELQVIRFGDQAKNELFKQLNLANRLGKIDIKPITILPEIKTILHHKTTTANPIICLMAIKNF